MQILVADDDLISRKVLEAFLGEAGYEVLLATDGQAAFELWQRAGARLVITDWVMPGLDGPGLIGRIRQGAAYTYVILLTGKDGQSDLVAGLEAGADDFLVKPFDRAELRARVAIGERILALETRLSEALANEARLARHDELTGLLNRRHFMELAERELSRVQRFQRPLAAIMLDIDHFKQVNDRHGHSAGDKVLAAVAECCRASVREIDLVARHGGEEFALLLPEAGLADAAAVAERLRRAVAEARTPALHSAIAVTVSLGVAEWAAETAGLSALLEQADAALYAAKRAGRNQVVAAPA